VIRAVFGDALLDPATGKTTRDAVVVIEDGMVTKAGARDGTQVPRDAERIEAEGLTLLPGLIDCHVHLCSLGEGLDFARELVTPPTLELMRAVRAARRTLDAGFTSVRDAAGTPAGVKMAIDAGYFPGPRMFVTISGLSQTGGHTDSHFMCGADLDIPLPDRPTWSSTASRTCGCACERSSVQALTGSSSALRGACFRLATSRTTRCSHWRR
jgi:imidazolonepropionase-like amidohydrolase